jgi:hypothetical protein
MSMVVDIFLKNKINRLPLLRFVQIIIESFTVLQWWNHEPKFTTTKVNEFEEILYKTMANFVKDISLMSYLVGGDWCLQIASLMLCLW